MNRTALAATAAAALLLLTGCTSTATTSVATSTSSAGESGPLVADSPAASDDDGNAAFLETVRANLRPDNVIPDATDAQLLEAGVRACDGIAQGADTLTLSVIENEPINGLGYYTDSGVIVSAARASLCG